MTDLKLKDFLPEVTPETSDNEITFEDRCSMIERMDRVKKAFNSLLTVNQIEEDLKVFTPVEKLETMTTTFKALETMTDDQLSIIEVLLEIID